MIIFAIIVVFLAIPACIVMYRETQAREKIKKVKTKKKSDPLLKRKDLSNPSRDILRLEATLDESYRNPNLEQVLKALDVKYDGIATVNDRYVRNSEGLDLTDVGYYMRNVGVDYRNIYDDILGLIKDVKEQEKQMTIAGIQHNLDHISELRDFYRNEREIVTKVTKELK